MRPVVKKPRPVIGWREWVALPELGISDIKAKIDTGARTSALHAYHVKPVKKGGALYVRFSVHPVQRHRSPSVDCEAPVIDERTITSSNGTREHRYVIETRLQLGEQHWPIEVTLTNRDEMGFRMLLGRQAIRRHVIVDPGRSYRARAGPATEKKKRPGRA